MSGVGVRKRGKNAKYVHVCPGLALHSAPSDVLRGPASIKGAGLRSQNSDQLLLPKLTSSFHQEKEQTVTGAEEKLHETTDQLDQKRFLQLKL